MKLLILGIDGLGYDNLTQHFRDYLPNLNRLCRDNLCLRIELDDAISPRNWVRIFSGVDLPWYRLYVVPAYVKDGVIHYRVVTRNDLPVRFIWDYFDDLVVINAPITTPTFSKNTDFKCVGYGMPLTFEEWNEELKLVTEHALKAIRTNRDTIAVYTVIDRMLHVTAKHSVIKYIMSRLDIAVTTIVREAEQRGYRWIIISDHGMKRVSSDETGSIAPRHDMPWMKTVTKRIHDHSNDALYITNTGYRIQKLEDVFHVAYSILKEAREGHSDEGV